MAVWHPRASVSGDGAATHQARSGGGPGEGGLAATSRSHRGRVGRALQRPEDLPEHLAWREGRDEPQRPLMAQQTRGHSEIKHPLQQPCLALARRPGASLWLVHALLTWCRGDGTAFRRHFNTAFAQQQGVTYDTYMPAYRYGYTLATDKRYSNRDWAAYESDARRDWERQHPGTWERFKAAIRHAWDEVRGRR